MSLPSDLLLGVSCGFTGSRHGITSFQRGALMDVLWDAKPLEAHYGDCRGADYEFFMICRALQGIRMVSHPGDDERWRMFTLADELRDPKPNLDRNHDIVAECDYLIACPQEERMVLRSGTWATVRHARHAGRTTMLILPSGRVDVQRVDLLRLPVEKFILSAHLSPDGKIIIYPLLTHDRARCESPCVLHHPSGHHMRGWELNWRDDIRLMERLCPHGIGHPDPDHLAFAEAAGRPGRGVHGCDGCCMRDSAQARVMQAKVNEEG